MGGEERAGVRRRLGNLGTGHCWDLLSKDCSPEKGVRKKGCQEGKPVVLGFKWPNEGLGPRAWCPCNSCAGGLCARRLAGAYRREPGPYMEHSVSATLNYRTAGWF